MTRVWFESTIRVLIDSWCLLTFDCSLLDIFRRCGRYVTPESDFGGITRRSQYFGSLAHEISENNPIAPSHLESPLEFLVLSCEIPSLTILLLFDNLPFPFSTTLP